MAVVRTYEQKPKQCEEKEYGGQEWEIAFTTKMIDESGIHSGEKAALFLLDYFYQHIRNSCRK